MEENTDKDLQDKASVLEKIEVTGAAEIIVPEHEEDDESED